MKKYIYIVSFIIMAIITDCSFLVNKFAFFPDRLNNIPVENLPENVEEVLIKTKDNEILQTYLIKSDSTDKILIYFHGNAGNISGRIIDLLEINKIGLTVLGVSYRGYGKSTGKPDEKGIYLDGSAAFDYTRDKLGYASKNIIILGRSIGSTVATYVAEDKGLGGLILVSPMTNGKEYASAHGLGFISFLAGNAFNNSERIKKIQCPTLVIHGDRDNTVPLFMGKAIYKCAATDKKQIVIIPGAGHNDISTFFGKDYWKAISEFILKS
jgi:fermentation-respiration switch protein FrsA (DUF1100 family)